MLEKDIGYGLSSSIQNWFGERWDRGSCCQYQLLFPLWYHRWQQKLDLDGLGLTRTSAEVRALQRELQSPSGGAGKLPAFSKKNYGQNFLKALRKSKKRTQGKTIFSRYVLSGNVEVQPLQIPIPPGSYEAPEKREKPKEKLRNVETRKLKFMTIDLLREALNDFGRNKRGGPDGLTAIMLQNLPNNVLKRLLVIIKASILIKYVPTIWLNSEIIFIPKPGKGRLHGAKELQTDYPCNRLSSRP